MRSTRFTVVAVAAAIVAGLAVADPGAVGLFSASAAGTGRGVKADEAVLITPGVTYLAGAHAAPPTTNFCEAHYKIACYRPKQIEQAYNLPRLYRSGITGKGQTIVIVDSFGSPTVARDLKVFDQAAGLPAPPSLRIISPAGKVPPYRATDTREGWAGETELDVEYAHAIAPGASILLVETPTSENEGATGFPAIVKAEKFVLSRHLGSVISQSFSASEQSFATPGRLLSLRGAYREAQRDKVTVLAASGDSGAADVKFGGSAYFLFPVTSWPDSDPLVTGIGATALHLNSAGLQIRPPTAWNDTFSGPANEFIFGSRGPNPLASGGGASVRFARPGYQAVVRGVVGDRRGVPDISMSGACDGAVDMYQSFKGQPVGWYPTCGTSEATPEFAGIVALADQAAHTRIGLINPALYLLLAAHAPGLVDVTSGGNTVSFRQGGTRHTVSGFRARPGYDLVTGVGTVNAPVFVAELAWMAHHPHASPGQLRRALRRIR